MKAILSRAFPPLMTCGASGMIRPLCQVVFVTVFLAGLDLMAKAQEAVFPVSSAITSISGTLGGTVSSDGGSAITERGVVFSPTLTNADPVIGAPGTTALPASSPGTGVFTVSVTALAPGTDYTFKAYAINSLGTGYSTAATFRTTANQRPLITVTGGLVRHYAAGSLATARQLHTATLMGDGSVLVIGGTNGGTRLASVEIYRPETGLWTAAANLTESRFLHTATLLHSGKVLVAGGSGNTNSMSSASLYDPGTGSWTPTASMTFHRYNHAAVLLSNGTVLVAGGHGGAVPGVSRVLNSTEIYDPATGTWTPGPTLTTGRVFPTASLLINGRVLIAGGFNNDTGVYAASAELYDPATGNCTATGSMTDGRTEHSSTLLGDGRVLVTGGYAYQPGEIQRKSTEVYDPVAGTWSTTGNRIFGGKGGTTTLMPDGKVIASGGYVSNQVSGSTEIYDPGTGFWSNYATLLAPRYNATATLLPGGKLLVAGGGASIGAGVTLASAELLGPVAQLPGGAEGSAVSRTGTFSDPEGNGTVTLSASAGNITQDNAAGTWSWTDTRTDGPADAVVTIIARDSGSASDSVAITFSASNAVPTAVISAPAAAVTGFPVYFTLAASDPSTADQATGFAWSVNFGDGTAPLVVPAGTASPAVRSHFFANSGVFNVAATATDKDGGASLTASHQITIGGPPSIVSFNYPTWSATTLTASANVLSDGGYAVTERGMVYAPAAANATPLLGGPGVISLINAGPGTGPFTHTAANLTPNTAYRYRFYAINPQGTTYTAVQSFATTANHPPQLAVTGATGTFAATGNMITPRNSHTATLLPDGRVLAAGGFSFNGGGASLREAELYDPVTGAWTAAANMAVARLWHTATRLADGNVLVTGGSLYPSGNQHNTSEVFESDTGTWIAAGNLSSPRYQHTATLLHDGQVLAAGGGTTMAELYNPATGLWTPVSSSAMARMGHTATLLNDGRVLITGGILAGGTLLATSEIYDPLTRTWSAAASTASPRQYHTANLLPDGRVMVTGGYINNTGGLGGVEIYDPCTNIWVAAASPAVRRIQYTASLLTDGTLLVTGGSLNGSQSVGSAESYNPVLNTWATAGMSATLRTQHTATVLSNSKVLIAGGNLATGITELHDRQGIFTSLEGNPVAQSGTFYDAEGAANVILTASGGSVTQDNASGTWKWTGAAGDGPSVSFITVTAVDSLNGTTSATLTLNVPNTVPMAAIAAPSISEVGTTLNFTFTAADPSPADAAAGFAWTLNFGDGTPPEFIPAGTASPLVRSHTFHSAGSYIVSVTATDKDGGESLAVSRSVAISGPPIIQLPVSSGVTSIAAVLGGTVVSDGSYPILERGVVYSIATQNSVPVIGSPGTIKLTASNSTIGSFSINVLHLTPATGYSFRAYAVNSKGTSYSSTINFLTAANRPPALAVDGAGSIPAFTATSNITTARSFHAAVLLGNGKVLVAGGSSGTGAPFRSAEVYDPATGLWTPTADLTIARGSPKAVVLPNGKVFVTGGVGAGGNTGSTELYDPAAETWTPAADMAYPRYSHTATLLANGKVLVAGGQTNNGYTAHAEIFDPAAGTWTATGSLAAARYAHTATLLPNGKVLVAGGFNASITLDSVEIYDPATGMWTATGSLATARRDHTETLLPKGKVLITGGQTTQSVVNYQNSAEVYDPSTGVWTTAGTFTESRFRHTATLLASGKVLITGGYNGGSTLSASASAALYDPATNLWAAAASLTVGRLTHTATLLADGRVLIAGGNNGTFLSNPLNSTLIYGPAAPVVSIGEGLPAAKTGTFSDFEGNAAVFLTASQGVITQNIPAGTWTWDATGKDGPSTTTVIITATDANGGVSRAALIFTVTNRPPSAGVTASEIGAAGVPVSFSFTATDPAAPDQTAGFRWTINYGDGSPAEIFAAGTPSPLVRSHTFAAAGTYTVTATATDKNSGNSAPAGKAITVFDGMNAWRLIHFGSINSSGNAATLSDADGDGLVNLAEFAFGQDPNSGASAQIPAAQQIGNNLVVTFSEPAGVAGRVIYSAEWTANLSSGSWLPLSDSGTGGTHTFSVPMANQAKVFIRLRVTEP